MHTHNSTEDDSPYLGLRPFQEFHQNKFFGRDEEIHILIDKILANRLTLLVAASGVGKSSLLQAGVMPALRMSGLGDLVYHNDWATDPCLTLKHSVIAHFIKQQRINADYKANLKQPLKQFLRIHSLLADSALIILLDQFEEFFYYQRFSPQRELFIKELAAAVRDMKTPCTFVFSMREDFAMELAAFKPWLSGVFDQVYRIEKLNLTAARKAIIKPLESLSFGYQPELIETLLNDLGQRERQEPLNIHKMEEQTTLLVEPPHLQIVCQHLWITSKHTKNKQITQAHYQLLGKADGILQSYFKRQMHTLSREQLRIASKAFEYLVSQHGAKMSYPLDELSQLLNENKTVLQKTLDLLQAAAILRRMQRQRRPWYELYHDIFAKSITLWNKEYKYRQMWQRLFVRGSVTVAMIVSLFIAYDGWRNYNHRHLRLAKETVANRIDLYQGVHGSWDLFNQQKFLFETDYARQNIEADKRFEIFDITDLAHTRVMQIGQLKLKQRFLDYAQVGLLTKANAITKAIQKSGEPTLIKQLVQQLPQIRVLQSIDELLKLATEKTDLVEKTVNALAKINIPKTTQALLTFLEHDNLIIRYKAAEALGDSGSQQAIPELLLLLDDSVSLVRSTAVIALGQLHAQQAIPKLRVLLNDDNPAVRYTSSEALGHLRGQQAISELLILLDDDNPRVRATTAHVLGHLRASQAIPKLLALLIDDNGYVRKGATKALGQLQAIPQLLPLLDNNNPKIRYRAIEALGQLPAQQAIPKLLQRLDDNNAQVRYRAAEALGLLRARQAIPKLLLLLKDNNPTVRYTSAEALELLRAQQAIPELLPLLDDKDPNVRYKIVAVLGRLRAEKATSKLILLLEDDDSMVRYRAVQALGQLHAQHTLPKLLPLLDNNDPAMRYRAAQVLGQLRSQQAIPKLLQRLEDNNSTVRYRVAQALGQLHHRDAIPKLLPLLKDNDLTVRYKAAEVLGQLRAQQAIPELLLLLDDNNATVRYKTAHALGQLRDRQAIPKLRQLLEDNNPDVRYSAANALGELRDRQAIPKLLQLLDDNDWTVRYRVIATLERLHARQAIPKLLQLLDDNVLAVGYKAIQALGQLQAEQAIPKLRLWLTKDDTFAGKKFAAVALSRMQQKFPLLTHWQNQQQKSLQEQLKNSFIDKEALASQLGSIESVYTPFSVKQLTKLLKDKNSHVIEKAIISLGNIGQYHPQWLQTTLTDIFQFSQHPNPAIKIASIKTLGQLVLFKGHDKAKDFVKYQQTIHQHLLTLASDNRQNNDIRLHALEALENSEEKQVVATMLSLLKDKQQSFLHASIYQWLGRISYQPALKELKKHLKTLEVAKQQWRLARDHGAKTEENELEDKSWQHGQAEFKIAYAMTQIDPQNSLKLLNHPLYQVRQAAIHAIAEKANGELIKHIFNYHQNFNEKDLPSPRPYATYRALDMALQQIEDNHRQEDLNSLTQLKNDPRFQILPKNKNNPSLIEQQREAINQRLDWTIKQLI